MLDTNYPGQLEAMLTDLNPASVPSDAAQMEPVHHTGAKPNFNIALQLLADLRPWTEAGELDLEITGSD